jgi:hypothetical protein
MTTLFFALVFSPVKFCVLRGKVQHLIDTVLITTSNNFDRVAPEEVLLSCNFTTINTEKCSCTVRSSVCTLYRVHERCFLFFYR